MSKKLLIGAVLLALPLIVQSGDAPENPFKKATVGDFAAYKMTVRVMDKDIETQMKQVVTAKDDTTVTVKITVTTMGKEFQGDDMKVDLTKPFDPFKMVNQKVTGPKFEKTGEGKETIKVAGQTYACKWVAGKIADKMATEIKIWSSPTIPLGGLAKMETKSSFATMTMELVEVGKK